MIGKLLHDITLLELVWQWDSFVFCSENDASANSAEDRYVTANTELFCLSTVSNTHHYSFLTWIMIDDAWIALEYYTDGTSLCIYVLSWSNKPSNRLSQMYALTWFIVDDAKKNTIYV